MGAKQTMKTFFAAIEEQVGMGGYGSKIKTTPMGPFKWNDQIQLWENVNNGMQLTNIAFQDMFIMDYSNASDSSTGTGTVVTDVTPVLTPSSWGTLKTISLGNPLEVWWAKTTSPTSNIALANNVAFSDINQTISITLTASNQIGTAISGIKFSKNSAAAQTYSSAISIVSGDTLKVGIVLPSGSPFSGSVDIDVTNTTDSNTILQTIKAQYSG